MNGRSKLSDICIIIVGWIELNICCLRLLCRFEVIIFPLLSPLSVGPFAFEAVFDEVTGLFAIVAGVLVILCGFAGNIRGFGFRLRFQKALLFKVSVLVCYRRDVANKASSDSLVIELAARFLLLSLIRDMIPNDASKRFENIEILDAKRSIEPTLRWNLILDCLAR